MARLPRIKVQGESGWYHLWNAAAGEKRAFPLENLVHRRKFIGLLRHFAGIYTTKLSEPSAYLRKDAWASDTTSVTLYPAAPSSRVSSPLVPARPATCLLQRF